MRATWRDEFEIVLRGRPAFDQFGDFGREIAEAPHVTFEGPYRNPEDLPRIYGEVHFSWLPDFFEEGMNSSWLLPNRLYEGCRHATVPLAMAGTETARFLRQKGLGFTLPEPSSEALAQLAGNCMDADRYIEAAERVARQDVSAWSAGPADCAGLVNRLRSISGAAPLAA